MQTCNCDRMDAWWGQDGSARRNDSLRIRMTSRTYFIWVVYALNVLRAYTKAIRIARKEQKEIRINRRANVDVFIMVEGFKRIPGITEEQIRISLICIQREEKVNPCRNKNAGNQFWASHNVTCLHFSAKQLNKGRPESFKPESVSPICNWWDYEHDINGFGFLITIIDCENFIKCYRCCLSFLNVKADSRPKLQRALAHPPI